MPEIVYVLTNEYMPGLVKIGMTQRDMVQTRVAELSAQSGVPVAYACHFAGELPDGVSAREVETILHQLFGEHRINPRREFFEMPAEKVVLALRLTRVREVTHGPPPPMDVEEAQAVERSQRRRSRLNMEAIGVPVGALLEFSRDPQLVATVAPHNQIVFEGETTSLSAAAVKIFNRRGSQASNIPGTEYWMYEGETLDERRRRVETERFSTGEA